MMVASRSGALAVGAAAVVAATGFLRAAVIVDAGTPTLANSWTIGQAAGVHADTATPGAFYSDETNFSGYSVHGAYSTQKYTGVLADDINTNLSPGTTFLLGQFSSSIANGATVSQTISPYIRFYDTTGAGGGPRNLLCGVNFSGLSVPAGNVSGFYYNASSSAITLPSSFWARRVLLDHSVGRREVCRSGCVQSSRRRELER